MAEKSDSSSAFEEGPLMRLPCGVQAAVSKADLLSFRVFEADCAGKHVR